MSSVKQAIHDGLLQEVLRYDRDAESIVGYEEDTEWSGYCETCWYEEHGLTITYKNADDETRKIFIGINLAEFIRGLE